MRTGRSLGVSGIVVGLVLSTVTAAAAERPAAVAPAGEHRTLTLVTGDRVTVIDGETRAVTPAAGREGVGFVTHTVGGHHYVFPADVMGLVGSGRVDRRLFDVSTLLDHGYEDGVPLIVTGQALPMAARAGRDLPAVDGVAITADPAGALWNELTDDTDRVAAGVSTIWLDGKRRSTLDRSTTQIGAPAAWHAGYTGAGVTVAVLDTGVDQTHPDLADREIAEQNFTDAPDTVDHIGHGTHVASTVAGTGAQSAGRYRGVAGGAAILDGKVLNDTGFGQDSWIIAGMQWATEQGADIVNLSLGGEDLPGIDPVEEAVNTLSAEHGTLFVVAAGNEYDPETIGSPGSAEAALTVGAVDRTDQRADFSSQGPTRGDGRLKPDLTAPGVDIVAALHSDGAIGEPVEPGYTALSGTSMATPHVAGSAALLAQRHPDWTGAQLKAALTASAAPNPELGEYAQGAGRVDVARAIEQTVVSEPTSVNLGIQAWPHDDDEPVTRPLSYRNTSTTDVTLALSLDTDAAEGLFTLGADEVTVPAGGTASVSVTADTRIGTTHGALGATVVATAGDTSVRTPIGVVREEERYTLTVDYLDENGDPAPSGAHSLWIDQTDGDYDYLFSRNGTAEITLPAGPYFLSHTVILDGENRRLFEFPQPSFELTADTTVVVDVRDTKPMDVTPPGGATPLLGTIGVDFTGRWGYSGSIGSENPANLGSTHLGPPPAAGDRLTGTFSTQWRGADDSFYGLAWFSHGTFFTGITKVVEQSELATVHVDVGAQGADRTGVRVRFPMPAEGDARAEGIRVEFPLPGRRTEHLLVSEGQRWLAQTEQLNGGGEEVVLHSEMESYRAGRGYSERVNYGVFGPALPDNAAPTVWASRQGEYLKILVPPFGDASGNGGYSPEALGSLRVYSGDELIGEETAPNGYISVPPEEREYRVTMEAVRGDTFALSPTVSAEWTFSSAYVPPRESVPLGVSALRFNPKLDDDNAAPAGRRFPVPVLLQRNGGETERARDLTVEVSYDEGATWESAPLTGSVAMLDHPADATSVSLRASARDRDGNTVEQTIIRAYHLR